MGNSFSSPTKDETRRVNRLSKPSTRRLAALNTPQFSQSETDAPELASGLIGWQNPWVGSHISRDVKNKSAKIREIPPTLFESEPESSNGGSNRQSVDIQDVEPLSPHSGSFSARSSVRRYPSQHGGQCAPGRPSIEQTQLKRANSFQTPLQRHRSATYRDQAHEATSSNTHFMVGGNQRFSLTRRRSLLTRPGLATRRTTTAARRFPSPIGEPDSSVEDSVDSNTLQWPLPPLQRSSLPAEALVRPTSPTDPRYTQLGALKLGSLRVVNGSASPCPSERAPLDQPVPTVGPNSGPGRIENSRPQGCLLEIPAVPDLKKSDDAPGSPFSFEKSPTITVRPREKSIFPTEADDEGISMCGESITQSENNSMDATVHRSASLSLNKSDSGYSSATSVHSVYRSRTRTSFDSSASSSCAIDSAKRIPSANEKYQELNEEKRGRHFSLQDIGPGNFSRLHPKSNRWYDSSTPSEQVSGTRTRRSTLCAPRNTEYPFYNGSSPYEYQSYPSSSSASSTSQEESFLSSRGPFYADRFSTSTLNVSQGSSSTATLETLNGYQGTTTSKVSSMTSNIQMASHGNGNTSRSRSRSLHGTRTWRHNSIIEIPQLPTILSPDHFENENEEKDITTSESRGRTRNRSLDFRRRKLAKSRPQNDVHVMTSPYAL
ncbi:hypothetical protein PENSTE_c037G05917 [Penicillium steckii]|uniref:Uncharacterized protein n=1 Tax=Penicillium steckii TaxID=303698 RepID=A0A1V6SKW9_9EURO|nr:hypothetical protein PENSTE_c037G05917 [Penicillium steckii]